MVRCCKNCGHVTYYRGLSGRYECMKNEVEPNGVCDRWTKDITTHAILKRIDESLRELKDAPDWKYELKKRPAFMENYRLLTAEEMKK